jgi:hypothetical protein
MYECSIILPHAETSLMLDHIEFLVPEDYSMSYDFIFSQGAGTQYRFKLNRPALKNAHLRVDSHPQLFCLSKTESLAE